MMSKISIKVYFAPCGGVKVNVPVTLKVELYGKPDLSASHWKMLGQPLPVISKAIRVSFQPIRCGALASTAVKMGAAYSGDGTTTANGCP